MSTFQRPTTFPLGVIESVDSDHDGICDAVEMALAEMFAPVLYLSPGESNYPVNVPWFLSRAELLYSDSAGGSESHLLGGPTATAEQLNQNLIGPPWQHNGFTTTASTPDSTAPNDANWYMPDLKPLPGSGEDVDLGSLNANDWVTYVHVYPSTGGGIVLQYWHVFSYNADALPGTGFGNHGGDWDATVHVLLGPNLTPEAVILSRHANDDPGATFQFPPPGQSPPSPALQVYDGTHPCVAISKGGHAAFASPADASGPDSGLLSNDVSGWRGATPDGPGEGTVWRTWSLQPVTQTGACDHGVSGNTPTLVNLGEYNPGQAQACTLLQAPQGTPAVTANIAAGQEWLAFSGHWGSASAEQSHGVGRPPRGPVFQGWDQINTYQAWYTQGRDAPADERTAVWMAPPTLSSAVDASGTVTLTATQAPERTPFGPVRIVVTQADQVAVYTHPIALAPAQGLQAYALDSLLNASSSISIERGLNVGLLPPQLPLDRHITLEIVATDGATNANVDVPISFLAPVSGPALQHGPLTTNARFSIEFPSTVVYAMGSKTVRSASGASLVWETEQFFGHYPTAVINGGPYGTLDLPCGPIDPSLTKLSTIKFPVNVPVNVQNALFTYLETHAGDPLPEQLPGVTQQQWAESRRQFVVTAPTHVVVNPQRPTVQ